MGTSWSRRSRSHRRRSKVTTEETRTTVPPSVKRELVPAEKEMDTSLNTALSSDSNSSNASLEMIPMKTQKQEVSGIFASQGTATNPTNRWGEADRESSFVLHVDDATADHHGCCLWAVRTCLGVHDTEQYIQHHEQVAKQHSFCDDDDENENSMSNKQQGS